MFKIIIVGLLLLSLTGVTLYYTGYYNGTLVPAGNCTPVVEWQQLYIPVPCNYTEFNISCEDRVVVQEKIIYKEIKSDKYVADVYYQVAITESKGFYNDIKDDDYDACVDKVSKAQDYIMTSIGYYQNSDLDFKLKIQALEEHRKILLKILDFCEDPDDRTYSDIENDYDSNYDKYQRYMALINETAITIR